MTIIDADMLWRQFGAAIDMLREPIRDCPDELWEQSLWGDQADQWVARKAPPSVPPYRMLRDPQMPESTEFREGWEHGAPGKDAGETVQ